MIPSEATTRFELVIRVLQTMKKSAANLILSAFPLLNCRFGTLLVHYLFKQLLFNAFTAYLHGNLLIFHNSFQLVPIIIHMEIGIQLYKSG